MGGRETGRFGVHLFIGVTKYLLWRGGETEAVGGWELVLLLATADRSSSSSSSSSSNSSRGSADEGVVGYVDTESHLLLIWDTFLLSAREGLTQNNWTTSPL